MLQYLNIELISLLNKHLSIDYFKKNIMVVKYDIKDNVHINYFDVNLGIMGEDTLGFVNKISVEFNNIHVSKSITVDLFSYDNNNLVLLYTGKLNPTCKQIKLMRVDNSELKTNKITPDIFISESFCVNNEISGNQAVVFYTVTDIPEYKLSNKQIINKDNLVYNKYNKLYYKR